MRACKDSQGVVDRAREESTRCVCEVRDWTKLVAYPRCRTGVSAGRAAEALTTYEARKAWVACVLNSWPLK